MLMPDLRNALVDLEPTRLNRIGDRVTETGVMTRLRLPVEGAVRALSSRVEEHSARLVAAIEPTTGGSYLLSLDLVRP